MKTKLAAARRTSRTTRVETFPSAAGSHRPVRPALELNRIMVPIDFSGCSRKALQYAVSLAQDYRASVVLIHVVEGRLPAGQLLQDREMELETLARQECRGRVPITTLIRVGDPLREIIDMARAGLVDLLLISTHSV